MATSQHALALSDIASAFEIALTQVVKKEHEDSLDRAMALNAVYVS